MNWLAFDIGGANLKLADGLGEAQSHAFPLWRDSAGLAKSLRTLLTESPACDHIAVTMTGELADCFATRTEGVEFILGAMMEAADGRHLRVYLNDGRIVTAQVALRSPLAAASSNWVALATFAGRFAQRGPALLVDVGSTTCDIVPLSDGRPIPLGRTDTDRLLSGELVYTGVERSPICALLRRINYRGKECPIAQELFATARDAYLVLSRLPEEPRSTSTADGRAATKMAAIARLGRMIGAEGDQFNEHDAVEMAEQLFVTQRKMIEVAAHQVIDRLGSHPAVVIVSGHGEFLARRALERVGVKTMISLAKELGGKVSRSAPAHALAVLAREAAMGSIAT